MSFYNRRCYLTTFVFILYVIDIQFIEGGNGIYKINRIFLANMGSLRLRNIFAGFVLIFITSHAYSQDTLTSDGLFNAARDAAFKQDNYPKAIDYCKRGLTISPAYADINIFLGRLYTWSKM